MGGKKKRIKHIKKKLEGSSQEVSYLMVIAIIAIFFSVGLTIKIVFFPSKTPLKNTGISQTVRMVDSSIGKQVQLISANFRCACGGCGELPLDECECNMPLGAQEEKNFMRQKLREGLSVEQIIQLVDERYGHRKV